ncbi:MAG: hypothetical protein A3H70_05095 [Candidatus Komeilibacteria bacterium RIFCSPLOWO2_02_FULL_48_11]|uniref:Uncharacterized protein n=1 Tax=Candidatus Komeilibacteria bacterium RIFCSPLOWO2_02_FULL_48_11 TaxID=1798553 RepID=A0A1G2BQ63_9BACT|nr:MAG: hypothetical protein A3H70_05095 [Candidatus Komeilibacteria bacterium RIFCSPLOWO2_02_FULL_48_11]
MNAGNIAMLFAAMNEARREDPLVRAIARGSPRLAWHEAISILMADRRPLCFKTTHAEARDDKKQ